MGDRLLGSDGCLNFFAGPTDTAFSASLNFYDVHYESHHLVGTSGGNTDDIKESLAMMADGRLNPVAMITHVGGLNAVPDTTIGSTRSRAARSSSTRTRSSTSSPSPTSRRGARPIPSTPSWRAS